MGASSSANNPTQDFLARKGGGRVFEVGALVVEYGNNNIIIIIIINTCCTNYLVLRLMYSVWVIDSWLINKQLLTVKI